VNLEARALTFARGGRRILDGVSCAFAPGQLHVVIGPNGAGKSTLLSALAGLVAPDSGDVSIDGAAIQTIERRALAQKRAYLPQNARSEWPITVERLVLLGLTPVLPAYGETPPALSARVDAAIAAFDLEALRHQAATTLSGGELARAMLARALVGDPQIVIVDEPIAGLDPRHALDAMRRLHALAQEGRIVIVAAHDLPLAARFAGRLLALKDGRVAADGPAESALTSELLADLFDVHARVERDAEGLHVRFV
jgi:iron complex transport system ATP-binding protein